jgi:hypothetical protein
MNRYIIHGILSGFTVIAAYSLLEEDTDSEEDQCEIDTEWDRTEHSDCVPREIPY